MNCRRYAPSQYIILPSSPFLTEIQAWPQNSARTVVAGVAAHDDVKNYRRETQTKVFVCRKNGDNADLPQIPYLSLTVVSLFSNGVLKSRTDVSYCACWCQCPLREQGSIIVEKPHLPRFNVTIIRTVSKQLYFQDQHANPWFQQSKNCTTPIEMMYEAM